METEKRIQLRWFVFLMCVFLLLPGGSNAVEEVTSLGQGLTTTESGIRRDPLLELLSGINPPVVKPATDCPICECGTLNDRQRIVGGVETNPRYKYPWMAAIFHRNEFACGGSLITNRHVLTAAHATAIFNRVLTKVFLLRHNMTHNFEENVIETRVKLFYQHPLYSPSPKNTYDIAVMLLDTAVNMTDTLRPICMPTPGEFYDGYDAIVAGWGALGENDPISYVLREVQVPIMSNDFCRENTGYEKNNRSITDDMLCAGYLEGGTDHCYRDSGGPLIVKNTTILSKNVYQLVGVVSFSDDCAAADYPGVYSRVTATLDWIRSVTTDGCYCSMPTDDGFEVRI